MPEMYLKQLRFTYSACGPFTKKKERIKKFKETGNSRYIYQNELDKACFQHGMTYGDFKQFVIKYCVIKHLILLKIWNKMDINVGLLQWFIIFFEKKALGGTVKNENISNKELAEELCKPIIQENSIRKKYIHLL